MTLRIGVDATCWANRRGYGRFTRELLPRLVAADPGHSFVFFLDDRSAEEFDLAAGNLRTVRVRQSVAPTTAAAADSNRGLGDMFRLTRAVRRERPDVFFSPSVYTYFPLWPGQRSVVTIHDAIAERFPDLTLPSPRDRFFWNAKVGLALRQSRLVLTVSHYAAREIVTHLGVQPSRIRVAEEAPAESYRIEVRPEEIVSASRAVGIPDAEPWFVYVGGLNPHKHVDRLLRAHAAVVTAREQPVHLVLVGPGRNDPFHGAHDGIADTIAACGTERLVHLPGYLPDDALRPLLAGAVASALISASEGFGLPAVEAASTGTPVIATVESPLPELLDGGGIFVAPGDVEATVSAMTALLEDPRRRDALGAVARERARALTWERTARAALDAIEEAAA